MSMMAMMMGGSLPTYAVSLSANRAHWRLSVDGASIPTDRPVILVITIASNIEVQSTSASFAALHINGLFAGSQLRIINNGYLLGMGGVGGAGNTNGTGFDGGVGGHGIYVTTPVNILIANYGFIWGGGGGGGGAGSSSAITHGGGGGGGAGGGNGGAGNGGSNAGSPGTAARTGTYGAGGTGSGVLTGGRGGAYGEAGVVADGGAPGNGGVAGYAFKYVTGANVVWQATGNRLGTVGT